MTLRRREFITALGGAAAWPLAGRAQGERVRRVGWLRGGAADDQLALGNLAIFRSELARLGWIEGRNLRIEARFGTNADLLSGYAAELSNLAPDLIVTQTAAATRAAQRQTQTIPIVFDGAGDPAFNGFVKNPTHPEGNITGISNLFASIGGKWLELLKAVAPNIEMVALIYNAVVVPDDSDYGYFPSIEGAARAHAIESIRIGYRDAVDLVHAIDAFGAQPNGGLIVLPPPPIPANRQVIFRLAVQHRLPAIYQAKQYATEGGLMAYGSNNIDQNRRAASFADRILRGAKVSELPVEYPTRFELVINLNTAKAIGLIVPPTLRAIADEVIE